MMLSALFRLLLLYLLCAPLTLCAQETQIVRYPRQSMDADPNGKYIMRLLSESLALNNQHYELIPSKDPMQQARAIYEMTSGVGSIDVMWTVTTDEREKQLIPIRIPIDKGLFGWRLALVVNPKLLHQVKSLDDLKKFSAGQGFDWPDVGILRQNGLTVMTATAYEPLFFMLRARRFDYFPRSMLEIQQELDTYRSIGLHIDNAIALHYPTALYFFVSPRKPDVAKALQQGLEKMLKNGQFEKLFQQYLGSTIQNARMRNRTVIELNNPLLKAESLALDRNELWYHP